MGIVIARIVSGLDYMAMRLDAKKAEGKTITLNWVLPDVKQRYAMRVDNSVLVYTENAQIPDADATVTMPRAVLSEIQLQTTTLEAEVAAGRVTIQGKKEKVDELLGMLVTFDPLFNIVTP